MHPDAQGILENLEDNREWFASQIPPESPLSVGETRRNSQSNEDSDGREAYEATKSTLADEEDYEAEQVRYKNDGSMVNQQFASNAIEVEQDDDREDKTVAETPPVVCATKQQEGKSSRHSSAGSPSLSVNLVGHPEIGDAAMSASIDEQVSHQLQHLQHKQSGCKQTINNEESSTLLMQQSSSSKTLSAARDTNISTPTNKDELQFQANKIQFQIILDEPEPEMMANIAQQNSTKQ